MDRYRQPTQEELEEMYREPTPEECMRDCAHEGACRRLYDPWRRTDELVGDRQVAREMMCDQCEEAE